jgi:hypothetical protein
MHVIAVCMDILHYLQQTKDNIQSEIYNILNKSSSVLREILCGCARPAYMLTGGTLRYSYDLG